MLQECQRFLKSHGIEHANPVHPPASTASETAYADRVASQATAKIVVYMGDDGPGMVIVPADCDVDLYELRRLLHLKQIRLATDVELSELFPGCEPGAMPPFGSFFKMPVLLDECLATKAFIGFNAGTGHDVIRMTVADFDRLFDPLVAGFAARTPRC